MTFFPTEQLREMIARGEVQKFYDSHAWKQLSKRVIAEQHGECVLCKEQHKLTRAVLVHHVKPLRKHPELAYSRTYTDADGEHMQLMPLCFACHERIHERGKRSEVRGYTNEERW